MVVFIIAHLFNRVLAVEWVKEQCNINGTNFSSRFRHHLGETPKQYINHHRIEAAKKLLANGTPGNDIPVSDIAYSLGFSSPSAFSRLFKRKTNITPSRWREANG